MVSRRIVELVAAAALVASFGSVAGAQEPSRREPPSEASRDAANLAFNEGTKLAASAKWAEALAAFERAQSLAPHAITLFNIGASERALGRYTAARETLRRAQYEHESGGSTLPKRLREDLQAFLGEIDSLLVRVPVRVTPEGASLAVDGRPLAAPVTFTQPDAVEVEDTPAEASPPAPPPVLVAGLASPGRGRAIPTRFILELDPGRHVLTFSRPGHSDGVVARDFVSGAAPELVLSLDELPAMIQVSADQPGALVTIGGRDLGPAPVSILRPAGSYKVVVEKDGFVTAEVDLDVKAGEESVFRATLPVDEPAITETWWFWTLTGAALVGVGVGTYFLAREEPEPQRATIGGGNLGWRVPLP
jgi:hypothetical protein